MIKICIKFNLRNIIILKGITQKELAELTGYSQSYISKLGRGVKSPTLIVVVRIAAALKVHPCDLIIVTSKFEKTLRN